MTVTCNRYNELSFLGPVYIVHEPDTIGSCENSKILAVCSTLPRLFEDWIKGYFDESSFKNKIRNFKLEQQDLQIPVRSKLSTFAMKEIKP